jgi:hypothetical protein
MSDADFAKVERQLRETLSGFEQTTDRGLRRKMLADLRLLLVEADRLLSETAETNMQNLPTQTIE